MSVTTMQSGDACINLGKTENGTNLAWVALPCEAIFAKRNTSMEPASFRSREPETVS